MPKATYDEIAPYYEGVMGPIERRFLSRLRAKLLSELPTEAVILELGAGTGWNFRFYPKGSSGAATDPSCEMLKLARSKERPRDVELIQTVAESLPFKDGCFDAAFATLVFCSVTSPGQAFAELRRVVKPGGVILLMDHVRPKGLLGPIFDLLNLVTLPLFNDNVNRRTAAEAQSSGLKLDRVESHFLGIINLISCRV
jgi:phosphatidylethanolamine/phosphatidyl-N-methylethanolamine N-methyltransferase